DSFYRGLSVEESEREHEYNFDHHERMLECVEKLKQGNSTQLPIYDFKNHSRCFESFRQSETIRYSGVSLRNKNSLDIDWYRQLRLVLSTEDKEYYLEHPIPAAPVAQPGEQIPPEDLAAHAAWVKGQKEVVVLMLLTMDLDIQRNLAHLGAYDMLQELKAMFSKQAEQELLQTVREFHTCKQEEGQSVSTHVLKMKGYIDNLERLGQPVGQNLAVSLILVSLNKDFTSFVQNFNMHGMGKTVNELHAMLKLHEESLPKKDANPALHAIRAGRVQKNQKNKPHKAGKRGHGKGKGKIGYAPNNAPFAPKPKIHPPPKKDNPAKDAVCH
ncbi:hypothetical protein Tco_0271492, partial [Tanacetum coccineum]